MHDMRKKALRQSGKTVSRKAQARLDSISPASSPGPSRSTSRYTSRQNSRVGSRYASEDEDGASDFDSSRLKSLSLDDGESGSDSDSEMDRDSSSAAGSERSRQHSPETTFQACLDLLQDRKRVNADTRTNALETYLQLTQDHYMGDSVTDALPTILDQFVKIVRRNEAEERQLALQGLVVTILSCPKEESADILDAVFAPVRAVCKAAETDEASKVAAMEVLTVAVLFGGGTRASADELLRFLLDIVVSDGETVEAMDSAPIVTAALRMWAFVASYMMPPGTDDSKAGEESDEEGEAEEEPAEELESGLVADSQAALEAFVDQLESTEVEVQMAAGEAIGLLFELSRRHKAVTGDRLDLREDPARLAEKMRQLARGIQADGRGTSTKAASRTDRRSLRETLTSVATSLELGTGPKYSTAGRPDYNPHKSGGGEDAAAPMAEWSESADAVDAFGYRLRLQVQNQTILIDSWALGMRVDTLRILLGRGMHRHLMENPLVGELLHATDLKVLQSDVNREQRKTVRRGKAARRR